MSRPKETMDTVNPTVPSIFSMRIQLSDIQIFQGGGSCCAVQLLLKKLHHIRRLDAPHAHTYDREAVLVLLVRQKIHPIRQGSQQ
jgi:hypothetical protein